MRRAAQVGVPPSQYLGLPWPAWCETDCLLDRAVAEHDRRLCGCGCGFWRSESHGDDADGEFVGVEDVCHARAAIDAKTAEFKGNMPPGLMVLVRRATVDD